MAESIITDYVLARYATITVNGIKQRATTASFKRQAGEVDVANLRSGSEAEWTVDITTTDFSMTIAVSAAEGIPLPDVGAIVPLTYETTGGAKHVGTLLITSISENASPRGLYQYSITGKTTGPTTHTFS